MIKKHLFIVAALVICAGYIAAQAEFYQHRIYKERTKTSLNKSWKFYKENPSSPLTTDPSLTTFDDAAWRTVNIPHSASYDQPTKTAEDASFRGTCWYRLRFQIPAGALQKEKFFLEFEGAMQVADVWLNGKKLGTHDNSGYTWFSFDITDSGVAAAGTNNILVVKLTNTYNAAIPPGCPGDGSGLGPDYYLFSGLYRNVWLISTNKCYIPLYGQQISVPKGPYTSGAPVRIKTTVKNDNTTSKSITLRYVVAYSQFDWDRGLILDSMTQTVAAGQSVMFDKTVGPIDNPHLWSLNDPYLYRVFTQVFADGVLVDDFAERFGVRWYTWEGADHFKLNDTAVVIKGNSLHQMFPWIQNAVPSSRFYKDIGLAKKMGMNMVRCAHYPRNPSYYNALDEIGMLCFVEVPTWGNGKPETFYPTDFWNRMNNCVKEMIEVGYNHPSIIAWGLFNEPGGDFTARITAMNTIAHSLDSTRMTYMANNSTSFEIMKIPDIAGLNYIAPANLSVTPVPTRLVNTEYHIGWYYDYAFRGDANDNEATIATNFWVDWYNILGDPALAGGTAWCHADYWSPMNNKPMGMVDCYRIPKSTYYLYRQQWLGVANDNPVAGLTATHLLLEADTNQIIADSVDCAFLYASVRDASEKCVHTGYESTSPTNVTFTVTGPANVFGSTMVRTDGGKCGILLKAKNTPGLITVIATSTGLRPDTVYINCVAEDNSPLSFITPIQNTAKKIKPALLFVKQQGKNLHVQLPSNFVHGAEIALISPMGRTLLSKKLERGSAADIDIRTLSTGFYYLALNSNGRTAKLLRKVYISK